MGGTLKVRTWCPTQAAAAMIPEKAEAAAESRVIEEEVSEGPRYILRKCYRR